MLVQSLVKAVLQQLCSCKSFFVWVPTEEQQLRSRKAVREAEEGSREKATHLLPTTTENQRELSFCLPEASSSFACSKCLLLLLHTHIDYLMSVVCNYSFITIFIYVRVDKDCLHRPATASFLPKLLPDIKRLANSAAIGSFPNVATA